MVYKTLTWKQCLDTIKEGLEVAVPLLVVLFAANILSSCLEALNAATVIAGLIEKSGAGAQHSEHRPRNSSCRTCAVHDAANLEVVGMRDQ